MIAIAPTAQARSGDPATTVRYVHTVSNGSRRAGTVNLRVTSSQGWDVRLFTADGESPLRDTDDDGFVDVGEVDPGEAVEIVVQLTLPALTVGGTQDVTTVTASIPGTSKTASAKDRTTVNGKLILTIDDDAPAVEVGVMSTGPWSGGCSARGVQPAEGQAGESLTWRVRGSTGRWQAFSTGIDATCFSIQEPGNLTYAYEYAAAGDPSAVEGDPTTVVTYRVTGDGG